MASPRQQLQRVLELRSAAAKSPGRAVSSHGRVPTRAFACAWLGTDAELLAGGALTLQWARSPANGPEPAPAISSGEPSRPPPPFEWREKREESAREETRGSTATGSTAARLRARVPARVADSGAAAAADRERERRGETERALGFGEDPTTAGFALPKSAGGRSIPSDGCWRPDWQQACELGHGPA